MTPNMLVAVPVAIALCVATAIIARARPGVTLPLAIHNLIWAAGLAIVGSELIHYSPISPKAWLVILGGIVAFNVGYLAFSGTRQRSVPAEHRESVVTLLSRRAVFALLGAYSVGFAMYLLRVVGHYGLDTILTSPGSIRGDSETAYLTLVPLWARLLMFLGPLIFAVVAVKGSIRGTISLPVRVAVLAYLGVSMIALLQRTNLFLALLWTVSVVLFRLQDQRGSTRLSLADVRRGRARSAVQAGAVVAVGLIGLASFQLVAGALGKGGEQAMSTGAISEPLARSGLTSPITYATGGIPAFGKLVDSTNFVWPDEDSGELNTIKSGDNNPQTWGGATFAQLMRVVPLVKPWEQIATFVEIPFYFNVYTWYESLYRDFRMPGVLVGMLVIGALLATSYSRRFSSTTAFWTGTYLLSVVFMCTFVPRFTHTLDIVSAGLALFLGVITDRRRQAAAGRQIPSTVRAHSSAQAAKL